jgi:hypothetical protein
MKLSIEENCSWQGPVETMERYEISGSIKG